MKRTYDQIVKEDIMPLVKEYFFKVFSEKDALLIDGVKAFNESDVFVPGKCMNVFSYILVSTDKTSPEYSLYIEYLKEIARFTAAFEMKTFGIFNYVIALNRLKENNLLEEIIDSELLEYLKKKLDWRHFVREEDLTLIDLPTNYYNVAFTVARYRELLGWESFECSSKLLEKWMKHIYKYSGELGYMDETEGEGRFDRYTVLIPAEIATTLSSTGVKVPSEIENMLKKSCRMFLSLANERGDGFSYGRSIGAHGDTAVLEVLSIGAKLNLLDEEELKLAYAYNVAAAEKFVRFWIDRDMNSVNQWDKGRRTDGYRHKGRILGETLDLCNKLIETNLFWKEAGYNSMQPSEDFKAMLENLPRYSFYTFSEGTYDRAAAVVRDEEHVFSLPLINNWTNTPYLPVPYENMVLESAPGAEHENLIPKIVLEDGNAVMPVAFMKNIKAEVKEDGYRITYAQDEMYLVNTNKEKYSSINTKIEYTFKPGIIIREEVLTSKESVSIKEITLEFGTFSNEPSLEGTRVTFKEGTVYEVELLGLDECRVDYVSGNEAYNTPHGPLSHRVVWTASNLKLDKPLTIKWMIKYN